MWISVSVLFRRRTEEESQDVGHSRMEVGQSYPAPALLRGRPGSNGVSKIRISLCESVLYQWQLVQKCQGVCARVRACPVALFEETLRRHIAPAASFLPFFCCILSLRITGSGGTTVSGRNMCLLALVVPLTTIPIFLLWYQCWFSSLNARKHSLTLPLLQETAVLLAPYFIIVLK